MQQTFGEGIEGSAPSEEERARAKQDIDSDESTLSNLQGKLALLESHILLLERERASVQANIGRIQDRIFLRRASLAPIRRVPDDILGEIFLHCLPSEGYPTLDPKKAPLLLTQVCCRWRRVSYAVPRLWSSLHVEPVAGNDDPYPDAYYMRIAHWLKCAGATPVSVSFRRPSLDDTPSDIGSLLSCLSSMNIAANWESFELLFRGSEDEFLTLLLQTRGYDTRNPFRSARKLKLGLSLNLSGPLPHPSVWDKYFEHFTSRFVGYMDLGSNTALRELSFSWVNAKYLASLDLATVPWSQLQVLDLHARYIPRACLQGGYAMRLLQKCPNLIILKIDVEDDQEGPVSTTTVSLGKLKQLSISLFDFSELDDIGAWFPLIEMPALHSLHLRARERIELENMDSAETLAFIGAHPGSRLTSVILDLGAIHRQAVIDFLKATPLLTQLHIKEVFFEDDFATVGLGDEHKFTNDVLESLTPQDDPEDPHSCPRLQYLKWEYNTCFTDNALSTLILRRAAPTYSSTQLKQVHVYFGRRQERDIVPDCEALIQGGLDLRLEYLPDDGSDARNIDGGGILKKPLVLVEDSSPPDRFGWD